MRAGRAIAAVMAGVGAALLGVVATRPHTLRVERATTIEAPPDRIAPLISDFRNWTAWSPYEHRDPAMKRRLEGPPSGAGAIYEWEGDRSIGKGRMEITHVSPSAIVIKLDFIKPFEAHNTAEFTLAPSGDGTVVTWAMHGPSPFMTRLIGMFFSMDRMVGRDFETGLANLKRLAEA
jgi:carbon monoxide dehydrogenase subunit G